MSAHDDVILYEPPAISAREELIGLLVAPNSDVKQPPTTQAP